MLFPTKNTASKRETGVGVLTVPPGCLAHAGATKTLATAHEVPRVGGPWAINSTDYAWIKRMFPCTAPATSRDLEGSIRNDHL